MTGGPEGGGEGTPPWGTPPTARPDPLPAWGAPEPPMAAGAPPPAPPVQPWQYGPYQPPPYGWQERPQSGTAVAALVCGLTSIVFPPLALVGLVLGIVALVQLRTGRERGRGLAIAGLVVSLAWPALLVAGVVAAVTDLGPQIRQAVPDPGLTVPCDGTCGATFAGAGTFVGDLEEGDCLEAPPPSLRDDADGTMLDVVDCDEEHLAQVYSTVSAGVGPYPGERAVRRQAQQVCGFTVPESVKVDVAAGRVRVVVAYPGPQAWDETHQAACLLVTTEPRTSGYDTEST